MKKMTLVGIILLFSTLPAVAVDGMQSIESTFDVEVTTDRMERILKEKGMLVFNRIKHSEGAGKAGVELRDTQLIIFGNPKVGAPLMQCQQSVALDLPQKALIWKDGNNKVWISWNDPHYLAKRHDIAGCEKNIAKIEQALAGMASAAAGNK